MATHGVRVAFNALAASNRSLLAADTEDVSRYQMSWAPQSGGCTLGAAETKGVWTSADGSPLKLVVLGVVDATRSRLGPYGTLTEASTAPPSTRSLQKARFSIDITYPQIPAGHVDEDIVAGLVNQVYSLNDITEAASSQLLAQGHPPPVKVTNWVKFRHSAQESIGSMRIFLGPVYEPATGPTGGIPDIEEDPNLYHGYLRGFSIHSLRHNSTIPCFTADGAPLGRTGAELRHELYHGRWVKVELDMTLWNLRHEHHHIFQLNATRLETINAPSAILAGVHSGFNPGPPGP